MIDKALEFSLRKLEELSNCNPNERLPKEEQLRCILYHFYTSHDVLVHPEAAYFPAEHGNKEECDLRLIFPDSEEWIELKTARCATGLVTKTKEESAKWDRDGWKLDNASPGATKTFILFTFTEEHPDDSENPFFSGIANLWPGYPANRVSTREFSWRNTAVKFATAWYWRW